MAAGLRAAGGRGGAAAGGAAGQAGRARAVQGAGARGSRSPHPQQSGQTGDMRNIGNRKQFPDKPRASVDAMLTCGGPDRAPAGGEAGPAAPHLF